MAAQFQLKFFNCCFFHFLSCYVNNFGELLSVSIITIWSTWALWTIATCFSLNTCALIILLFVFCNIHLFKQIIFAVSCYSLFPLLFEDQEYPIKVLLLLTYGALTWVGFSTHFAANPAPGGKKLDASDSIVKKKFTGWISLGYLLGMFAIEFWSRLFHHNVFGDRLPFLPLMMVSVYCGVGMMYSWIWQLSWIIRHTWYDLQWSVPALFLNSNPSAETKLDDSPPWLMHWAINVAASKDIFLWFIHSFLQRQRNLGDVILSWCNICYSVAACISPVFMVGNIFPWQFWQPDVLSVWCKKENFQFFITEELSHMHSVSM